jgi:hypothetical protein
MLTGRIELDILEVPGLSPIVLMPDWRVSALAESLRRTAEPLAGKEKASLLEQASNLEAEASAIRREFASDVVRRSWPFRPYSMLEKNSFRRDATRWQGGKATFDDLTFNELVLRHCLSLSDEDLAALSPAVGQALLTEIFDRCEPDPEKARFLLSSRIECASTAKSSLKSSSTTES